MNVITWRGWLPFLCFYLMASSPPFFSFKNGVFLLALISHLRRTGVVLFIKMVMLKDLCWSKWEHICDNLTCCAAMKVKGVLISLRMHVWEGLILWSSTFMVRRNGLTTELGREVGYRGFELLTWRHYRMGALWVWIKVCSWGFLHLHNEWV